MDERHRLDALADYQLLDTPNEEIFDAFTRLAAQICGVPISLISLIDSDRQWFKSNLGLEGVSETPRSMAFCAHAILDENILEIEDASVDERFADNPLVTGDSNLRFYAGVPLVTTGGAALGTLCVLDRTPHILTMEQRTALRMIADAVLQQFEARRALLRLFDSSQIELFHVDIAAQRIVFASEAARRNLGYAQSEIQTLDLATLIPALSDRSLFARRIEQLRASEDGRLSIATVARRKDGTTYPIELRIELIRTPRGELALAFGTDLTEAQAAQESIALLTTAIEEASEAIVIVRPAPGGSRFVYANAAFLRQKGTTREQLIGAEATLFDGALTDRAALDAFDQRLLRGETGNAEYVTYRADGTWYNAEITARPIVAADGDVSHFVMVQRDVTERVRRAALLEEENQGLNALAKTARGLFGSLDAGVLVTALATGIRELIGGAAGVYVPNPVGGFVLSTDLTCDPNQPDRGDDLIESAAATGTSAVDDGALRVVLPVPAPAGQIAYVIDVRSPRPLTLADVSTLELFAQYFAVAARNVELYSELASRRASVVELNQIKNDLITMLAHDFKGPLTTIVGFADVLAEEAEPESDTLQYLQLISSSAMRLASLATDTLALSRLEENELVLDIDDVDLSYLVRDVARSFAHLRPVTIEMESENLRVAGDIARLRQVFENLIGNAIKYSPGGEPVEIVMRTVPDGVETAISDRGIGIPDADRARLFGRFARASNARSMGISGSGFGLYLCRTIVDLHGGRIDVESKQNEGSTFRVVLPNSRSKQRPKTRRILVHDRDGESRSYIGHSLRTAGYAVTVLQKASDVVALATEVPMDVAIVDIDRLDEPPETFLAAIAPNVRERTGFVWLGAPAIGSESWDAVVSKPFLMKDLQLAVETAARRVLGKKTPA